MLTEWRNFRISVSRTCWKQYTPLKFRFAGGIISKIIPELSPNNLLICTDVYKCALEVRDERKQMYTYLKLF